MDQVRFGRVLGKGARQMIKTLASAAEAAKAEPPPQRQRPPSPAAPSVAPTQRGSSAGANPAASGERRDANTPGARPAPAPRRPSVKSNGKRFGEAAFGPFVRLSGVLWLEVTGVFFGLIALFAAEGAWRSRAEIHDGSNPIHFVLALVIALLFGYFCVTSYVRARRRERRR